MFSLSRHRALARPSDRFVRSRWAAGGAAIAVAATGLLPASASLGTGERPVFVPITPCRLVDTRPALEQVGPRATALGASETYSVQVRGTNGNCTIPNDAVGVVMNVAAIGPTADSFLTVFPSDADKPLAANLNWSAGQPPLSNAVTADLSADGKVSFYNLAGTVNIAADIVGYFVDHNHNDLYYTKAEINTALAGIPTKPTGPQTLLLGAASFQPLDPNAAANLYFFDHLSGGDTNPYGAVAQVQLPHGAKVTAVKGWLSDGDVDYDVQVSMFANPVGPLADGGSTVMASVATSGSSGSHVLTDSTIAKSTIDNANYTYEVGVVGMTVATALDNVQITYTLP